MILLEPTEEQLKFAIDLNRAEFLFNFTADERISSFQNLQAIGIYSSIKDPLVNRIAWFNYTEENQSEFEDLIKEYIDRGIQFIIHTGPSTKPANIESIVKKFKLERISEEKAMYLKLSNFEQNINEINNFNIEVVDTTFKAREFANVFAEAFGATKEQAKVFFEVDSSIGYGKDSARVNYIGFYEDKPVTISSINYAYGVAGIYAVCTLPEYRGKGFGKLMTIQPLIDAKERNYKFSILHASNLGYAIYKRLGFKDIGTCQRYFWKPPL